MSWFSKYGSEKYHPEIHAATQLSVPEYFLEMYSQQFLGECKKLSS